MLSQMIFFLGCLMFTGYCRWFHRFVRNCRANFDIGAIFFQIGYPGTRGKMQKTPPPRWVFCQDISILKILNQLDAL